MTDSRFFRGGAAALRGRQPTTWPIFPKTAWKWRNFGPGGGEERHASLAPTLDPPMYCRDDLLACSVTFLHNIHDIVNYFHISIFIHSVLIVITHDNTCYRHASEKFEKDIVTYGCWCSKHANLLLCEHIPRFHIILANWFNYHPHPKDGEDNVFTGVCLSTPRGYPGVPPGQGRYPLAKVGTPPGKVGAPRPR